jgi:hypothetical protein
MPAANMPAASMPAATLEPITWTPEAEAKFVAEVPKAVQKIARKGAEKKARAKGITVIDLAFYEELKKEQGVSK